jgi:hypothetical protein
MNFIISSIILLAVIMIIIYILSIDNNIDKLKNKLKEIFSVVKSKKINYLNEKDNKNLLLYIKQHFNSEDNVTIPLKIYYNKTELGYEMNNINIICYKYINNEFIEIHKMVDILFVPFEKDNYISDQSLFNLYGNYKIKMINDTEKKSVQFTNNDTFIPQNNQEIDNPETYTDVLDMIPDIIHLSEDNSSINTDDVNETTDTNELISHNLK